jgi:uncharacterized damage-inducible protein DinB
MKQVLQQYAAYNYWANQRLIAALLSVDEALTLKETGGSYPNIFKIITHLWEAEAIWWQRIKLAEHVINPAESFEGNFEELSKKLLRQSFEWDQWVRTASEKALTHVFAYRNSKREEFKQPVNEALLHLFNHQSYHRGQVIMQMRIVGAEKVPVTDFIQFVRKKL